MCLSSFFVNLPIPSYEKSASVSNPKISGELHGLIFRTHIIPGSFSPSDFNSSVFDNTLLTLRILHPPLVQMTSPTLTSSPSGYFIFTIFVYLQVVKISPFDFPSLLHITNMPVRRSICHIILSVNTLKSYHPGGGKSAPSQARRRLSQHSLHSASSTKKSLFLYVMN